MAHAARRRIVGIVDSDSYAKWGASLLSELPEEWDASLVVVRTALSASDAQLNAALTGTRFRPEDVRREWLHEVVAQLSTAPPDAVFVSTSGAASEVLITAITASVKPRPVIMTGLPGISSPAKYKGLFRRAQSDLFVLHSHREIREYRQLAAERGISHRFGLATLPFLGGEPAEAAPVRDSIVFAAQPSVPRHEADRRLIAEWLAEAARRHPELRVVVKVRAQAGEQQTHRERHPYAELLPEDAPDNLVVEAGSMADHLARAVGFVTVSSTAAIEAIAADVPSIVLADFGVTARLINQVFLGSGLLGTSRDLIEARFHRVVDGWRVDNYFHAASDDDWMAQLGSLAMLRDNRRLPARPAARHNHGGALRRAWDRKRAFGRYDTSASGRLALAVGLPYVAARSFARSLRRDQAAPSLESEPMEQSVPETDAAPRERV